VTGPLILTKGDVNQKLCFGEWQKGITMGDSERRRARESERFRRAQNEGKLLWEAFEQTEKGANEEIQVKRHNEHVMRVKKNESERHYRIRKREEGGKG